MFARHFFAAALATLFASLVLAGPALAQDAPDASAPDTSQVASTAPSSSAPSDTAETMSADTLEAASDVPADASPDTAATASGDSSATAKARENVQDAVQNYGGKALLAVLVLVLTYVVVWFIVYALDTYSEQNAERRLLLKRLVPIVRVTLWSLALFLIMRVIFDVNAQNLLAAATAIGVAVGFAAQDLLKNVFGGLVIIFDQPFQVGDKISVGGTYGEVMSIGLRSTRIVTPDDNLVSVPNAQVVDGQVSNANAGALDCQVVTDLHLPGWADETRAKAIAYQAAASSKYVYLAKPIVVIVKDEFKEDHLLHLKVKAYVLDARYEFLLASDVTERARRIFRAEGLIPRTTRAYVDLPSAAPPNAPPNAAPTPSDVSPDVPGGDGASGDGASSDSTSQDA